MNAKPKIVLFVCYDVTGLLILNGVVPRLKKIGVDLIVINTREYRNRKLKVPTPPVVDFYNVQILSKYLVPFLDKQRSLDTKNVTYRQLLHRYCFEYIEESDINSGYIIEKLRNDAAIVGGISFRFRQVFEPCVINLLSERGFFWNLHSGLLPKYKGLLTPYRAIANGETVYGLTLHEMAPGIDEGAILATGALPLRRSRAILDLYIDSVPQAILMVVKAVNQYLENCLAPCSPPSESAVGQYYTNPTDREMIDFSNKGILYAYPNSAVDRIASYFTSAGSAGRDKCKKVLLSAIRSADGVEVTATAQRALDRAS